ncbi:hypothetical protein QBC42DRAFT_310879 [Cladorrhinum samala]|uniref:Uncharacterized protein n=1 Tax=Cladorrhinum samala TaxID=585594 RepID=A0AAV9HIF3_9PEZI|nr:hypothetical protein QBC42DRAFT_310879 [Cladorrhinum samala]
MNVPRNIVFPPRPLRNSVSLPTPRQQISPERWKDRKPSCSTPAVSAQIGPLRRTNKVNPGPLTLALTLTLIFKRGSLSFGYQTRLGRDKDDKLPIAIAKVVRALRKQGIKVYNIHSRCTTPLDPDPDFFRYSFAHAESNSAGGEPIFGIPFMTSHIDTCTHLAASITTEPEDWFLPKEATEEGIRVSRVKGYHLTIKALQNIKDALAIFSAASSGRPNMTHGDIIGAMATLLKREPAQVFGVHVAIGAAIPVAPESKQAFAAWTVVAPPTLTQLIDGWKLFVCREYINGTLVVAVSREMGPEPVIEHATMILGYLTITDHTCGSFLVPSTAQGKISIVLDDRGGTSSAMDTSSFGKRVLEAELVVRAGGVMLSGHNIAPIYNPL